VSHLDVPAVQVNYVSGLFTNMASLFAARLTYRAAPRIGVPAWVFATIIASYVVAAMASASSTRGAPCCCGSRLHSSQRRCSSPGAPMTTESECQMRTSSQTRRWSDDGNGNTPVSSEPGSPCRGQKTPLPRVRRCFEGST
jgi:hypothetical protein